MILAIDIGNTNIVIGGVDSNKVHFVKRLYTLQSKTEDEYTIEFKTILATHIKNISGAILSSVVPAVTRTIESAIKKTIKAPVISICDETKISFKINMDKNVKLGDDLVAAAEGAINEYGFPLIIIDMGTATTITVIDENKNFIGGMLFPGLKTSQKALSDTAVQLPNISLSNPKNIIGKNTEDCMASGLIYGSAAMLDGVIDRIEKELKYETTTVVTGGLASKVVPYCKRKIICDDNMILKGLFLICKNNM